VARLFDEYADILEIQGANPFRVRAYRTPHGMIGDLPESGGRYRLQSRPLAGGTSRNRKRPGRKICAVVKTGEFPQLAEARLAVPVSVVEMLRISGPRPEESCRFSSKELSVRSLDDLRQAARRVRSPSSRVFGKKTEQFDPRRGSQAVRPQDSFWPRSRPRPIRSCRPLEAEIGHAGHAPRKLPAA